MLRPRDVSKVHLPIRMIVASMIALASPHLGLAAERPHAAEPRDEAPLVRTADATAPSAGSLLAALPLAFEPNRGQVRAPGRYLSRGPSHTLLLDRDVADLLLAPTPAPAPADSAWRRPARLRLQLVAAEADGPVVAEGLLPGRVHHLEGGASSSDRRNLPRYAQVRMPSVYEGIDWVFHGRGGALEFDFEIAPGADPEVIAFEFEGADRLDLDADGGLRVHVGQETLRLDPPVVYQPAATRDGDARVERDAVAGRFLLEADTRGGATAHRVRFEVGDYDRRRALVIDPVLEVSTHLGATGVGEAVALADSGGGTFVIAGHTPAWDFPITPGVVQPGCGEAVYNTPTCTTPYFPMPAYPIDYTGHFDAEYDAFIAKVRLSSPPELLWSTYLGGLDEEKVTGVAVDADGRVHLVGSTRSDEFPTTPDAIDGNISGYYEVPGILKYHHRDGFYTVLSPDGSSIEYSTLLGQSNDEAITAIDLDPAGNAVVAGFGEFALGGTLTELAFVAKLDQDATPVWTYSDFYSSICPNASITPTAVVTEDQNGLVYVVGETTCSTLHTTLYAPQPTCASCGAEPDAFVFELKGDGTQLRAATFLGGSEADGATDVDIDPDLQPVVVGYTRSANFPTVEPVQAFGGGVCTLAYDPCSDGFVTVFEAGNGTDLVFSTFFGGSGDDRIEAVAAGGTSEDESVYWTHDYHLTGTTESADLPLSGAFQTSCVPVAASMCDETAFVARDVQRYARVISCCPVSYSYDVLESLSFSTYLGGASVPTGYGDNRGADIVLNKYGWVFVAGRTGSDAFPLVDPLPGSTSASDGGVYLARISPAPEPTAAASWTVGLAMLFVLRRRGLISPSRAAPPSPLRPPPRGRRCADR